LSHSEQNTYWDTWYRLKCPECEKLNWVCWGNEEDVTVYVAPAVKCWNCKHCFWVCACEECLEEVRSMSGEDQEPEDHAEEGRHMTGVTHD